MTINTTESIFDKCKIQFPGAKHITEGNADVNISVVPEMDAFDFNLKIFNEVATITGGSDQSCLWGYYEYLARFYGYIWQTPDRTFIGERKPIRNMNYTWKHPYDICWFHWRTSKKWQEFLNIHRCISKMPHKEFFNFSQIDWWEKYGQSHPHFFARNPKGEIVPNDSLKFRYEDEEFRNTTAIAINAFPGKYTNLFPTDGVCFNATSLPGENPLDVWRGNVHMTEYMLDYYDAMGKLIDPEKEIFIYAYNVYKIFPWKHKFDGRRFKVLVADSDKGNFYNWKKTGAACYWRPNIGYDLNDPKIESVAIKLANDFMAFKNMGMNGFMFDIKKISFDNEAFFIYLICRQIYSNLAVKDFVNEFNCSAPVRSFPNQST